MVGFFVLMIMSNYKNYNILSILLIIYILHRTYSFYCVGDLLCKFQYDYESDV